MMRRLSADSGLGRAYKRRQKSLGVAFTISPQSHPPQPIASSSTIIPPPGPESLRLVHDDFPCITHLLFYIFLIHYLRAGYTYSGGPSPQGLERRPKKKKLITQAPSFQVTKTTLPPWISSSYRWSDRDCHFSSHHNQLFKNGPRYLVRNLDGSRTRNLYHIP